MGALGDLFPKHFKQEYAERVVQAGAVIKAFVLDTNPPKEKRFIVLGVSDDKVALGVVFINTELNLNVFRTQEMQALQYPVRAATAEFLDHDSFVDCSKLYEKSMEEIQRHLQEHPENLLGETGTPLLGTLQAKVSGARTISKKQKERFGLI